jgi:hypothetical protein
MAIFAVLGSNEPEKLKAIIEDKFPENLEFSKGQWFVSASKATTQEVSERIGDNGENGIFIVIPVNNYWGLHSNHTWEWLEKKGS